MFTATSNEGKISSSDGQDIQASLLAFTCCSAQLTPFETPQGAVCDKHGHGDPKIHQGSGQSLEGDLELQYPEETFGNTLSNERAYHQRYLKSKEALGQQLELHSEHFAEVSKRFLALGQSGLGDKVINDMEIEYPALVEKAVKAFTAMLDDFRMWRLQVMNRKSLGDRFSLIPNEPHDDEPSIL